MSDNEVTNDDAQLLRKEDVSRLLNVGFTTVNKFAASGQLRSIKIGRSRRYTRQAVADFIAEREVGGDV